MAATNLPIDTKAPIWAHLACFAIAVLLYGAITTAGWSGHYWLVLVLALLASPGLMTFAAVVIERRQLGVILDLKHQSWAFMFGDLALAALLAIASSQWPRQNIGRGLFDTHWWWLVGLAAGVTLAVAFHFFLDKSNYVAAGAIDQLSAPTKLIHDEIAYFVLAGSLVYLAVPVLVYGDWASWAPYVIVACFLIWIGGGVHDTKANLDPHFLHPSYDWANFRPLT